MHTAKDHSTFWPLLCCAPLMRPTPPSRLNNPALLCSVRAHIHRRRLKQREERHLDEEETPAEEAPGEGLTNGQPWLIWSASPARTECELARVCFGPCAGNTSLCINEAPFALPQARRRTRRRGRCCRPTRRRRWVGGKGRDIWHMLQASYLHLRGPGGKLGCPPVLSRNNVLCTIPNRAGHPE